MLCRYGGIFERGSKEYTLDDFYALQLDKMDRYLCLKKSDVVIPTEEEEESSSDEDDGEDEGEEDEDEDDEASGDDGPDTPKREPAEVEVEVEAKEDDVSSPSNCVEWELNRRLGPTC